MTDTKKHKRELNEDITELDQNIMALMIAHFKTLAELRSYTKTLHDQ